MINVFHIVSNKIWSGPEQYAYDLALRLRNDDNYYIEVVCKKSEAVFNKFRSLEIPVSILPLKGLTDLDSPVRFARLLKRGQNIIHVHTFHDAFAAIWAKHIAENPNTRIVLTLHGVNRPRINYLSKKVYRDLDRIVFVCHASPASTARSASSCATACCRHAARSTPRPRSCASSWASAATRRSSCITAA